MVQAQLFDFEESYGQMWVASSRCMNCGHVHDPVIEANRQAHPAPAVLVATRKPDYLEDSVHLGAEAFLRCAA
jgi:hypothetical protein